MPQLIKVVSFFVGSNNYTFIFSYCGITLQFWNSVLVLTYNNASLKIMCLFYVHWYCMYIFVRMSPTTGVKDSCKLPYRCWELNLGPLEEQPVQVNVGGEGDYLEGEHRYRRKGDEIGGLWPGNGKRE